VSDDRIEIAQLLLRWAHCRDNGLWDELAETFHPDGQIQVTWYRGAFDGFVAASRKMAAAGARSTHVIFPSMIDVCGQRAVASSPVEIRGRATIALGVEVDMTSEARFFDFVEQREGQWRLLRRVCIYQKGRIDSVRPSLRFSLLSRLLPTAGFDPAYRNLGVVLKKAGFDVVPGQVVEYSPAATALHEHAQRWLKGDAPPADLTHTSDTLGEQQ
jgi:hypothetical protein